MYLHILYIDVGGILEVALWFGGVLTGFLGAYSIHYNLQNSVGFPYNILLIEMLLKSQIIYVKLCLTQLP